MKKIFLLLTFVFATLFTAFSQSEKEPQYVNVDWKVGENRTIRQIDSTIIYLNDSVLMSTGISSDYKMKIVSLRDTVYEVLFKQVNVDTNIKIGSELISTDPIEKMMQGLMTQLQEKMLGFEYSFLVGKNTASAFEIKNQSEMIEMLEEMVVVVLNSYLDASKIELDDTEKKELQLKLKEYMDEKIPAGLQTILNSFNYIFQAYSFSFILDETYTLESMVYDVDEVRNGNKESPVTFVVNSFATGSKLNINYVYIYDKETAYQEYIVSSGRADEIPMSEFDVKERVVSEFNTESSWITSSTSYANVKMGKVRVDNTTYVTID
ncbi:MAG: hypothetical protein JKX84_07200 [Flavobacteriales bacterium]|nr:hypothetical protein [Flavobacteriales bacterium]